MGRPASKREWMSRRYWEVHGTPEFDRMPNRAPLEGEPELLKYGLWLQQQYWLAVKAEGAPTPDDFLDPANAPPRPDPAASVGRPGPRKEFKKLVESELKAVLEDEGMGLQDRIIRAGIMDLMLSDRPSTRKEGLKMYLQLRAQDLAKRAHAARQSATSGLRERAMAQRARFEDGREADPRPNGLK